MQSVNIYSQVGINTDGSEPDSRTILDVKSTNKGVLLPRMTDAERNAIGQNVPLGMIIFNTTDGQLQVFINNKWYPFSTGTPEDAPIVDADGNVYTSVIIGTQTWLKENLKTTKYRNGDTIGTTYPATLDITGQSTAKYQWAYGGNESNVATYGRLYTWGAATDSRNICPAGYHVPSDAEWFTLENYIDPTITNPNATGWIGNDIGTKLKATSGWNSGGNGTDNYCFLALPSGCRYNTGTFGSFGNLGYWWSSAEDDSSNAWQRALVYYLSSMGRAVNYKNFGFSVRCLRDN